MTTKTLRDVSKWREQHDFLTQSFGAGVQSTASYIMSTLNIGGIPTADVAIFADVGDEPQWVYDHLERMIKWGEQNNGPRIDVVSAGKLSQDVIDRHEGRKSRCANMPAFTLGSDGRAAPLRRSCTKEYKVDPIEKHTRKLLGYRPRQRIKESVGVMLGISVDEIQRMKPNQAKWATNLFPLIETWTSRSKCVEIIESVGIPVPKKSSCVFCPYHSDVFWLDLQENHPEEFQKAVDFDKKIRDMSASGVTSPVYLHRSLDPLDEVDFTHGGQGTFDGFGAECEGHCGL